MNTYISPAEAMSYTQALVDCSIKKWADSVSIPRENFQTTAYLSQFTDALICGVQQALYAHQAEPVIETRDSVPASMSDWGKFHINRLLAAVGIKFRLSFKSVPLIRSTQEVWHVCPHLNITESHTHVAFLRYGSDFAGMATNQRRSAEEIVQAALAAENEEGYGYSSRYMPTCRLSRAVHRYQDSLRPRMDMDNLYRS